MGPAFSMDRVLECIAAVGPSIVVLDYLQRIECCDGVAETRQRLNMLISQARDIAAAGISVVLVSAVGRTSSKKNGGYNSKEVGLACFRESSEIEYGVDDAFVMVNSGDGDTPDGRKVIELRHVKSRNHRPAHLKFEFDGAIQQFKFLGELDADNDAGGKDGHPAGPFKCIEKLPTRDGKPSNPSYDSFAEEFLNGGDA
jgi:replicative DNA helicase